MAERVDHETIEDAFRKPAEVIGTLPETTESREAKRLLEISEKLTHEARERWQSNELRGPALTGWPWRLQVTHYTRRKP